MQSLLFFNKEGDNLNFQWDNILSRWSGDLMFHPNSNDTFKTIGIYMFERVPKFEYEVPGVLGLQRFQLFNEYRFNFYGSTWMTQSITKIESVNADPTFFSKWIYGEDFESKFPLGSQIVFNSQIFEFSNPVLSYTVVATKKGAILILSNSDNQLFSTSYGSVIGLTSSYEGKTISGVNAFGVYNYIDQNFDTTLSVWNEVDFYTKYFEDRKLTFVNTENNDGVFGVKSLNLIDKIYLSYELPISSLSGSQSILMELILKTDLPTVYTGQIDVNGNTLEFGSTIPTLLKPGTEFIISNSFLNPNPLTVAPVPTFEGNVNQTFYATGSQVFWNNLIYECVQAYTWTATSSINPSSGSYWGSPTYLITNESLVTETIFGGEIQLTTNKLYWNGQFTQSGIVTLNSLAEISKNDLSFFNIDVYFDGTKLKADLIYPSFYAEMNFYTYSQVGNYSNVNVGGRNFIYEYNIELNETVKQELNVNRSSNFDYNIVFTDLDEFGIEIEINGQIYNEEIDFFYNGLLVDLPRTIDRTLRNWMSRHNARLLSLGIICNLQYIGTVNSIYFNSINMRTEYPNVPLQFQVRVGTTADFFIEHSDVIFFDMSNYLLITINNRPYPQEVLVSNGVPDMITAINEWVETYSEELIDWGIYVTNANSMLRFRIKEQNQRCEYSIQTGKSNLPGVEQYRIVNKILGGFGSLVTSNAVTLPIGNGTYSFEDNPFATGQVMSLNNTNRPLQNQEYNILLLDPFYLILSYEGPFWGDGSIYCDASPYVIVAFDGGFGATGCVVATATPYNPGAGQFNNQQFDIDFNLYNYSPNSYDYEYYTLTSNSDLVDLIYLQMTNKLYVLGDNLSIFDVLTSTQVGSVTLTGNTQSISVRYNVDNNFLYCLTNSRIYVVDPITNVLSHTIVLSENPRDLLINYGNGDVYVSYPTDNRVDIWFNNNFSSTASTSIVTSGNTLTMLYHESESDIFVVQDNGVLLRIDGSTRTTFATYSVPGLNEPLLYIPIDTTIYFFDDNSLRNIDLSGNLGTFGAIPWNPTFSTFIYNNINGDILIDQSTSLGRIDLDGVVTATTLTPDYGLLDQNQTDGDIYIASAVSSKVLIVDSVTNTVKWSLSTNSPVTKMTHVGERGSMFGIMPGNNGLIEILVSVNSIVDLNTTTYSLVQENFFGTMDPNYTPHPDIWLSCREYIRRPRENYNDEPFVKYVWKWETDEYPQMFLYDFSGDQLPITGSYAYVGEKPLTVVSLNKFPNKNLDRVGLPEFQQTIFSEIVNTLDHVDSQTNLSIIPEPIETFIGFRSDDEGWMTSNLLLIKRVDIDFTITSASINNDILTFKYITDPQGFDYGQITFDVNSNSNFSIDSNNISRGLKPGQYIKVFVTDNTNVKNKYMSMNNGKLFKIRQIFTRNMVVDFVDQIENETTKVVDYPSQGRTTYLKVRFKVVDQIIGRFPVMGQTEIEDIRYKIELGNTGHLIDPGDVYIFKPYDINEQGIDWTYLNRKRKEMMLVRSEIFPYVGSYKAIINAINYFGYNDLELYEYYRNINPDSPNYNKLYKIEIPDIFDNTVEGWTENDFIKHTMPNPNYEDTNLFNLTYKITDKEGTNILQYSLAEVIIKLQGLKYWLQRKVIPITHRILDITGRADFVGITTITHRNYDAKILNVRQNLTPIDFNLTEAYLSPVNSGSPVYTCHVEFTAATSSNLPDYFTLLVRTYKTYKEWNPFTTYGSGDTVIYFGQLYQSVLSVNKLRNPRKYDSVPEWSNDFDYEFGQRVSYDNYIFEYIGTQSYFSYTGLTSNTNSPISVIQAEGSLAPWSDITEWRQVDFEPVQYLTEYRTATHSYNFTIDSNIDPFVVIEVTSDNGYGQIYTSKKNYEIRGLNDLFTGYEGDPILPISQIPYIQTPLP